jgi:hypothetical protein
LLSLIFTACFVCGCLILGSAFAMPFLYLALLVLGAFWVDSLLHARDVARRLFLLLLFGVAGYTAHLTHTTLIAALIAIEYLMLVLRRLVPWNHESDLRLTGIACGLYAAAVSIFVGTYRCTGRHSE